MTETIYIPNIKNYTTEIIDGTLILTPKQIYITETELSMTCLKKSTILNCIIQSDEEIISTSKKYQAILLDVWKNMATQKILQNTTFNFKLQNVNGEKGYNWKEEIKMSYQGKDANSSMKEILNMIKLNNFLMKIQIKLENNRIINMKIDI